MRIFIMLLVIIMGILQPVQAGLNASVFKQTGSRIQAGWINGLCNVILLSSVLLVITMIGGKGGAHFGAMKGIPWWGYLGGVIGALIVITQLTAAPELGAGLLVALFVAGQCFGSLMADSLGLPGYEKKPFDWSPVLGLGLVFIGAMLVVRRS